MSALEKLQGLSKTLTACPPPFVDVQAFNNSIGYIPGRLCQDLGKFTCCLPCPMTDWVYPESFNTLGLVAEWIAVVSTALCGFLLLSWAVLPVEKTSRHYLSVCLTSGVLLMNLGFVVPLAGRPDECADRITPHGMQSNSVCAASGSLLILGGWTGVMWVFLRSLSLHLQICWQVVVGRSFMWASQVVGWGVPILGVTLALIFSGVSFRFGKTCHINHANSLADLWIPLLVFAGLTIIIQFATFGYCIRVYLASLADNNASTENSGLPSYSNSIRTMTPRQAYRRVRRVIQLQWRGILIVLIIIADVIFFSIIFVFQDNTIQRIKEDGGLAASWVLCLAQNRGNKHACFGDAKSLAVSEGAVGAVLTLLSCNGIWLVILLGRWSMVTGWGELLHLTKTPDRAKREFISVDARVDDLKKDTRSYEMLSRDQDGKTVDDVVTPGTVSPTSPVNARSHNGFESPFPQEPTSPPPSMSMPGGRRTPDYFGNTARYHAPVRSFSSPRPPPSQVQWSEGGDNESRRSPPPPRSPYDDRNPLGMNRI